MTDVEIKKEKEEEHLHTNDQPPDFNKLLEDLKREEQSSSSEDEEKSAENNVHRSQSRSPISSNRKRKACIDGQSLNENSNNESKRMRETVAESSRSKSRSPSRDSRDKNESSTLTLQAQAEISVTQTTGNSNTTHQQSPVLDKTPSPISGVSDAELQNLLKEEDYDSDDEPSSSNQGMPAISGPPPVYGLPPGFPITAPIYNPAHNMMGNMPPNVYSPMYNIGIQPQFYGTNVGNLPMMGFGYPQMMNNSVDQNEVQCLPVVNNTGFTGMPAFKRIKLEKISHNSGEKTDSEQMRAEDRRKNVFEKCINLVEQLEVVDQTGKFTFTPTVAKLDTNVASNSVVQKISNVSYEFHSIGPKLNLTEWGLKEIGTRNVNIAKKIAISADEYFKKIKEKANTTVRKLIKVEDDKADENKEELKMEEEEPTLSSFLKNSMTQTDALVCKECVARKRIIGHNIGVQTIVYSGSVGTQTTPRTDDSARLAVGLNANQLKALYEFSRLIREPPKNTTTELYRLRESLMDMYNLSQRLHNGPVPNTSVGDFASRSSPIPNHASARDPRTDARSNFESRNITPVRMPIPNLSPSMIQGPAQQFNNYQQLPLQMPNQQLPRMQWPRYQPSQMQMPLHQPHIMQMLPHQQPAAQFSGHPLPSYRNTKYLPDSMQGPPRSFGRGSHPR